MIVKIKGEYIKIGQLLKKLNYIQSGGQAKEFLKNRSVKIDGVKPIGRNSKVGNNSTVWIDDDLYKILVEKDAENENS